MEIQRGVLLESFTEGGASAAKTALGWLDHVAAHGLWVVETGKLWDKNESDGLWLLNNVILPITITYCNDCECHYC